MARMNGVAENLESLKPRRELITLASPHPFLSALQEAGWQNPATGEVPTVPVISPQRQSDYGLLRSDWEWKALEVNALDHRPEASDHLPWVTMIEFL